MTGKSHFPDCPLQGMDLSIASCACSLEAAYLENISSLRNLPDGWDGFGAGKFSDTVLSAVEKFAMDHPGETWHYAPMSNGNIMAELGDAAFEISENSVEEVE